MTTNDSLGLVRGALSCATDKELGVRHGKRGDTKKGSKRRRFDRYGDKITGRERAGRLNKIPIRFAREFDSTVKTVRLVNSIDSNAARDPNET